MAVTPLRHDVNMGSSGCAEVGAGGVLSSLGDGLDGLDGRRLADRLAEVERAIRALEAVAVSIVAEADRSGAFRDDRHVSVRGWVKASIRAADVDVTHRVRSARLAAAHPQCVAEMRSGRLGVAQVRELARVYANSRCVDLFSDVVDTLVDLGTVHTFEVFRQAVRQWERVAGADGAHRAHDDAHAARSAAITQAGDTFYLDARVGVAQGAGMAEVLEHFTRAEFDAEWDDLRARFRDDASPDKLERSEPQRRADALAAIFAAAAATPPGSRTPEPIVNILVDQSVYEAQLAAMLAGTTGTGPDAADVGHLRCRATSGVAVDPADAVVASLVGHVRRVVLDTDGVIIDLGRRRRLFTGSARSAHCSKPPSTVINDASGLAASTTDARSTTLTNGVTAAAPTNTTPDHSARAITASNPAATTCGATPTGDGTPTDPTAPRSQQPDLPRAPAPVASVRSRLRCDRCGVVASVRRTATKIRSLEDSLVMRRPTRARRPVWARRRRRRERRRGRGPRRSASG